ncbi:hypothetical protein J537_1542 [Acinetobacter baumannii 1437282]|nr:hypothetical protein J537_1542 [Acinetobacter baumannii 1437282]
MTVVGQGLFCFSTNKRVIQYMQSIDHGINKKAPENRRFFR